MIRKISNPIKKFIKLMKIFSLVSKPLIIIFLLGGFYLANSQIASIVSIAKKESIRTSITYCNLELAETWKLANITFNSLYEFRVDKQGKVTNIEKIRDDFIGEESVKSCISSWRISGFPDNSRFSVYFKWKHGKGWVEQKVSSEKFTNIMTMENVGVEETDLDSQEKANYFSQGSIKPLSKGNRN